MRPNEPLSWTQARIHMRHILQAYIREISPSILSATDGGSPSVIHPTAISWRRHISQNLDVYCGSIPLSISIFIVSILSYTRTKDGTHIAAAVILMMAAIISAWMVRQRELVMMGDVYRKKRKIIESFLVALDRLIESSNSGDHNDGHESPSRSLHMTTLESYACKKLAGTSLTDIYPVYRTHLSSRKDTDSNGDVSSGEWHQVPSLLLVEGDYIALKIGDYVPADCRLASMTMSSDSKQGNPMDSNECIQFGEKIAPPSDMGFNRSKNMCNPLFPSNKCTLPPDSPKLLQLCNDTRVYVVQKTPLEMFLRKDTKGPITQKSPQIHRKIQGLRLPMYTLSIITMAITLLISFLRFIVLQRELDGIAIFYVPLLTSIGTLPVVTPIILYVFEIIGTCRILVKVDNILTANESGNDASPTKGRARSNLRLFAQYFIEGIKSRFFLCSNASRTLVEFPIASSCFFEQLGVVTALAVVDDELACDPVSTPQQLLIPTSNGLKLLDLFPKFDEDANGSDEGDDHTKSFGSSVVDDELACDPVSTPQQLLMPTSNGLKLLDIDEDASGSDDGGDGGEEEVQFEDPNWWHHLPALKCIGLSCLLLDRKKDVYEIRSNAIRALVQYVTQYYCRSHLLSLSRCIGFTTRPNIHGLHGDISPFIERKRLHIIATRLLQDRIHLDRHAIGLEESRSYGLLRPDSTSLLVQDNRSNAYQLLTMGDPQIVSELCSDTWQGEAISPFGSVDRQAVLDSSRNWQLADLDVTAFSYAPIPYTLEQKLRFMIESNDRNEDIGSSVSFLVDNRATAEIPLQKDFGGDEWSLVRNQIFLGLLGSSVSPRKDIMRIVESSTKAGVRFVYFSPRNMRRCKELASQMGIEMSWNCAISLRPLNEGQDNDEHRMNDEEYVDWVTNAKLPNGVENVKKHIDEVDNVPLLVSLYTDVTKETTSQMVKVFEDYHDTVLSIGLSHISHNDDTYSISNVSIGLDVLHDTIFDNKGTSQSARRQLDSEEISFISAIAAHACVLQMPLDCGLSHLYDIIQKGRAALHASTAAFIFILCAYLSFGLFVLLSTCSVTTVIPHISALESCLYLLLLTPLLGTALTFTGADTTITTAVPQKNNGNETWLRGEQRRIVQRIVICSLLPALFSQLVYVASFVPAMISLELDLIIEACGIQREQVQNHSLSIIRCKALNNYDGRVSYSLGRLMLVELSLCTLFLSSSYMLRFQYLNIFTIWKMNRVWVIVSALYIILIALYVEFVLEDEIISTLPWYIYVMSISFALITMCVSELLKKPDIQHNVYYEKLRRLQFETRLGMWSPK